MQVALKFAIEDLRAEAPPVNDGLLIAVNWLRQQRRVRPGDC